MINFIIAILFIISFFDSHKQDTIKVIKNNAVAVKPIPVAPIVKPVEKPINKLFAEELACTIYGPITEKTKSELDPLLQENFLMNQVAILKKPVFEIYWNLGPDKAIATKIFNKQKSIGGPFSNDRFQLSFDDKNWIVSIAHITGDEDTARNTTVKIAEKSSKANVGGRWQYRSVEDVYFYTFYEKSIPEKINNLLNIQLPIQKNHC